MKKDLIFPKYKNVYKGNLHSHSTRSDGKYTPEDVINGYKNGGYNFLCLSDHHNYYKSNIPDNENFIILDGMEGGVGYSWYHIHAVADYSVDVAQRITPNERYNIIEGQKPQETIDEYASQGNICIINHPRWSMLTYDDLLKVDNYLGIEVFNTNCDRESLTGYATDYYDYALQHGRKLYAFASDDAHAEDMDKKVKEFFGGWICVSSDRLTQIDIVNSIKSGDFYASMGPEIHKIEIIDNEIHIETSPVMSIAFISYPEHGLNAFNKDGSEITSAAFKIKPNIKYVRIEITDKSGKKAWSNPVYYNDK